MRNCKRIINYGYIGVGGQKGDVFGIDGVCTALPASQYKDPTKILIKQIKNIKAKTIELGFLDNGTGQHQSNTVYSIEGLCPCISTLKDGGTQQIKVLDSVCKKEVTEQCTSLMDGWDLITIFQVYVQQ